MVARPIIQCNYSTLHGPALYNGANPKIEDKKRNKQTKKQFTESLDSTHWYHTAYFSIHSEIQKQIWDEDIQRTNTDSSVESQDAQQALCGGGRANRSVKDACQTKRDACHSRRLGARVRRRNKHVKW